MVYKYSLLIFIIITRTIQINMDVTFKILLVDDIYNYILMKIKHLALY